MRLLTVALLFSAVPSLSFARADDRPFVFVQNAAGPVDRSVDAFYTLNVGASSSGAIRFSDPTVARPGTVQQIGAQAGLLPFLSFGAFGLVAPGSPTGQGGTGGGYVHLTALRPRDGSTNGFTLGFTLLSVREFEGAFAFSLFNSLSYAHDAFLVTGNVQLERRFASGADPLDVLVRFGVGYDVLRGRPSSLRFGVEYVGQDLESYVEHDEAEGGAVHLVAPSVSASLRERRLDVGFAPGVLLSAGRVGFGSRLLVAWRF
ncbi:MAG: hypothetical protein U0230_20565 [Polyangiales bacterium]